jgi:hypothetical protein
MLYESFSVCMRMGLFHTLQESNDRPLVNSIIAGSISQLATYPFFIRNIANHTSEVGNTRNWINESLSMQKVGLLAGRGALIGMTHLYVYNKVLKFLEQDSDPFGTKAQNVDK